MIHEVSRSTLRAGRLLVKKEFVSYRFYICICGPWTHWRTFKVVGIFLLAFIKLDEYVILQLYIKCPTKSKVVNTTQMFWTFQQGNIYSFVQSCNVKPKWTERHHFSPLPSSPPSFPPFLLAFILFADLPCEKPPACCHYSCNGLSQYRITA